jgi:hypothetical protein
MDASLPTSSGSRSVLEMEGFEVGARGRMETVFPGTAIEPPVKPFAAEVCTEYVSGCAWAGVVRAGLVFGSASIGAAFHTAVSLSWERRSA